MEEIDSAIISREQMDAGIRMMNKVLGEMG